jgi:uncharacterized Zn-finger protein
MNETKIEVSAVELDDASYKSAYCPNPRMPIWSSHPRIYLDFAANGEAKCPYCSTMYRLKPGTRAKKH